MTALLGRPILVKSDTLAYLRATPNLQHARLMTPNPDIAILRWLARRTHSIAPAIGTACGMAPGEVRGHLASLESLRLVASRQDKDAAPPRRVYYVTSEGRRKAGIVDARMQNA